MRVLVTNVEMQDYSGTTLYVKELAMGLKNAGILVEVFTFRIGTVGQELLDAGIRVSTDVKKLAVPDVIHVHHNVTAWPVLHHFKKAPVIFWIHSRLSPLDLPPKHKNIMAYLAVDFNCKERYVAEQHFSPDSVKVIYNWVNTDRFKRKKQIMPRPKKALVFSNYAQENNFLPTIRQACQELNIELAVMGKGTGTASLKPENHLGEYDLVFAKAKAAMEAVASGCAVCVCDFTGLAGLARLENYEHYRQLNFGMKLMTKDISIEELKNEIALYDADEIAAFTNKLRTETRLEAKLAEIMSLYDEVMAQYKSGKRGNYSFTLSNYIRCRKATFRIWMGLWSERHLPALHRWVSKTA